VCYRWHLPDPVYFSKSLKVEIEHRGNLNESEDGFFLERPDFFSSVAYWYQVGEPKTTFSPLPGWNERRVPWEQVHLVKSFRYARNTGDAKVQVQTQGFFGARPVLAWPNKETGALLTLPFDLSEDGRYAVRLTAASGPGQGVYDIEIDSKKILRTSFRAAEDGEIDRAGGQPRPRERHHDAQERAHVAAAVEHGRLLELARDAVEEALSSHVANGTPTAALASISANRLSIRWNVDAMMKNGMTTRLPGSILVRSSVSPVHCCAGVRKRDRL
jgi:hypothetical protein